MKQNPLLVYIFVVVSASLALGISAAVAQGNPPIYPESPDKFATNVHVGRRAVQKRASGKVQAAYFSNWYVLRCPERPQSGH
jgi:hypothetical protein